jgi:hypothetical protein
MLHLIEEAEEELHKIIPKRSHKDVKDDLAAKQHIREEVKKATEDILLKMKELSDTLANIATADQQDSFNKEVSFKFSEYSKIQAASWVGVVLFNFTSIISSLTDLVIFLDYFTSKHTKYLHFKLIDSYLSDLFIRLSPSILFLFMITSFIPNVNVLL